jgi:MYXO-CTERM domain-containing protein
VVVEENDTVEITGGCTDFQGGIWHGRFGPSDSGTFRYELDNFGVERSSEACAGQTTDYVQNGILGLNGADFEFIMVSDSSELADDCSPLENRVGLNVLLAQEDITEDDGTTTTIYNSSGRVAVSDATKEGVADIRTDDEQTNGDWCGTEAWSGSTTVEGQQTLVITYDGQTDCDPESTVTWSVDGADQGELTGVSCATTPATGLAGLLVGLLAALRRRR